MNPLKDLAHYAAPDAHRLLDEADEIRSDLKDPIPTEAELNDPIVAPGRPATVPLGVMYQGDWRSRHDGMARHVREHALSLAQYLPLNLCGVSPSILFDQETDPEVLEQCGYLGNVHCTSYPVAIRHFIFGTTDSLKWIILPGGARLAGTEAEDAVYASTIVSTSWERDRVAPELIEELRKVGQLWVPCKANRDAFVTSGMPPDKVRIVPYPYDPSTHLTTKIGMPRGNELIPRGKLFYAIGKWEPRKNYDLLVGAFLCGFTPKDRASLTIKTFGWGKWTGYPSPAETGKKWMSDPRVIANGWKPETMARRVRIMDEKITDQEIADLHRKNNVYVSPSHGEAVDIPAFDAMCAGNALVHVGYGGSEEYAGEGPSVAVVPYTMGPVHEGYRWEPGAQWANCTMEDLIAGMRQVQVPERREHPLRFNGLYSRGAVGALMSAHVEELVESINPETALLLRGAGCYG